MSDNLNDIEFKILDTIYTRDYDRDLGIHINNDSFPLTEQNPKLRSHEAGHYLERLRSLNYLEFSDKAILRAGHTDNKYKNNIYTILWEGIKLSYKGRNYVEQGRKSKFHKFRDSINRFFIDIGKELRSKIISHIVTFLLGMVAAVIYYNFIKK
jgi:hypothetical protein